jgi:DNA-binding transcriptional LysR family regulator
MVDRRAMPVQNRTAPSWDDLRVFLALARTGSLSSAGRALGVNHATIARRIAALARDLGLVLFEHRARGYAPTADGAALVGAAERMEAAMLEIERRAAGRAPGLEGTVRITATDTLASHVIAPALAALHARHPALAIDLAVDNRALSLARREADIALRWARPRAGDLYARKLSDVTYAAFARGRRPAAGVIAFDEDLADIPEARWLARAFPAARVVLRSSTVAVQFAAARAGLGIAALPRYLAAGARELREVATPLPPPTRELWLIIHRDLRAVPRVRAVAEFLAEAVRAALRP